MPNILGKVKRTVPGQPIGDIEELEGANLKAASKETISGVKKLRLSGVDADNAASTLDVEIQDLGGVGVWEGTQSEYDAVVSKVDGVLYIILS